MPRIMKPDADGLRRANINGFICEAKPSSDRIWIRHGEMIVEVQGPKQSYANGKYKTDPPKVKVIIQRKTYPDHWKEVICEKEMVDTPIYQVTFDNDVNQQAQQPKPVTMKSLLNDLIQSEVAVLRAGV